MIPQFNLTSITDYIIFFLLLLLFLSGWMKGLLRTLMMPIIILFCSLVSFFYFGKTGNFINASLITLIGPFLLNLLIGFSLNIWHQFNKDHDKIWWPSRLLAGLFEMTWGGLFMVFFILVLSFLPYNFIGLGGVQNDIFHSKIYGAINLCFQKENMFQLDRLYGVLRNSRDPSRMEFLKSTPEYAALTQDQKAQDILQDDALFDQAKNGEVIRLLGNPKFMSMLYNQDLLKKFLNFEKRMIQTNDTQQGQMFTPPSEKKAPKRWGFWLRE